MTSCWSYHLAQDRRFGYSALLLVLVLLSGCQSWDWRGPGFDDKPDWGPWANSQREPGKSGELFGLSNKAREIERDVGVR